MDNYHFLRGVEKCLFVVEIARDLWIYTNLVEVLFDNELYFLNQVCTLPTLQLRCCTTLDILSPSELPLAGGRPGDAPRGTAADQHDRPDSDKSSIVAATAIQSCHGFDNVKINSGS